MDSRYNGKHSSSSEQKQMQMQALKQGHHAVLESSSIAKQSE
jgi:hypothetical protein